MALTFPDSPNIGDLYTAENGVVYEWNGTAWDVEVAGTQYWTGDSSNISYLGNVGIGTASVPTAFKVEIQDSGTTGINIRNTNNSTNDSRRIAFSQGSGNLSSSNTVADIIGVTESLGPLSGILQFRTNHGNDVKEAMRIDGSGRLLVGTSSARTLFPGYVPLLQLEGTDNSTSSCSLTHNNNSGAGPTLFFAKSRGTSNGASTVVNNGDILGQIIFNGADGTDIESIGAFIAANVDGTPGANDLPTRLVFSTTRDGASSPTAALTINRNGELFSVPTYTAVTTNAANVFIASNGNMSRSSSSRKYKTNIENLEDQYADRILDCRPVWYRSTAVKDNPDHGYWGFIAEEVAEIDPRLVHWKTIEVTYDENGSSVETSCDPEPEGVQYERFVPHLLNLIKRQQQAIETLQTEVAALKQV